MTVPDHGIARRYWSPHFCRCDRCRAAQALYRRQRQKRIAEQAGRMYHPRWPRLLCPRGHVLPAKGRCLTCHRDRRRDRRRRVALSRERQSRPWTVTRGGVIRRFQTKERAMAFALRLSGPCVVSRRGGPRWTITRAGLS